jgi:hypothetical protein
MKDFQELLLQTGKILSPYTRHKVAENNRAAVKMSVMAGIDMSMVPEDYSFTLIY